MVTVVTAPRVAQPFNNGLSNVMGALSILIASGVQSFGARNTVRGSRFQSHYEMCDQEVLDQRTILNSTSILHASPLRVGYSTNISRYKSCANSARST